MSSGIKVTDTWLIDIFRSELPQKPLSANGFQIMRDLETLEVYVYGTKPIKQQLP